MYCSINFDLSIQANFFLCLKSEHFECVAHDIQFVLGNVVKEKYSVWIPIHKTHDDETFQCAIN